MSRSREPGAPQRLLVLGTDAAAVQWLGGRDDLELVLVYGPDRKDSGLAPVSGVVTQVFTEDELNVESVLSALARAGHLLESFDGVYTKDEYSVVTAAVLARAGRLTCMSVDSALRFRDKALQKARVAEAGVATAGFAVIDDLYDFDPNACASLLPGVVKPIAGAGTQHTVAVRNVADLALFADQMRASGSPLRTFLVEQFVDGEEWMCDGIVFEGELLFMALGDYDVPNLTAVTEHQPVHMYKYGPDARPGAYELVEPVVRKALAALGLDNGLFHLEVFAWPDTGRVVFSECAARRGGGLTQEQVEFQFGVNLAAAGIECALGIKPDLSHARTRPGMTGAGFLPTKAGYLLSCPDAEALAARPDVEFAKIEVPLGVYLPVTATNLMAHKIGQVMVSGPDRPSVAARLAATRSWFHERVRTHVPETDGRVLRQRMRTSQFVMESRPVAVTG